MNTTALLVIAHGSRQPEANADLHQVVELLRQRGSFAIVEPGFLELASPTIAGAAGRCTAQGAERVILLPYFLSPGVHARDDLEEHRRRLAQEFPRVEFRLAAPLGPHPALIDVALERARDADNE